MSEEELLKERMKQEGFPLENKTAELFKLNDFHVTKNNSHKFASDTKADIDIFAYRGDSIAIVQCKGSLA